MPEQKTEKKSSKIKEYSVIAAIFAGIVFFLAIFVYLPIKLIPKIFSNLPTNKQTATTLSGVPVSGSNDTTSNSNTSNQTTSNNSNSSVNTSGTKTTYTKTVSYYGYSDLSVQLISTGIVNPYTRQYIQTAYSGANDEVAVKFIVRNTGTNVSGPFKVRLNMPSSRTPFYESAYQQSIKPGDAIEFTGTFDSPSAQGLITGYITVDPYNEIVENSENNNNLAVQFNISGTSWNGTIPRVSLPYGTYYTWVNLDAVCSAYPQTAYVGNQITWTAAGSGGNGYFTYSWNGTDGLTGNGNSVSKTYYSSGLKVANVTVTSNGQSITKQCIMNVI
jgi:hypothetical protein